MTRIHHIQRADLDADKWNACIVSAPNGLIYAYTFYLDAMCDNWDALVLNDYEAVMPLPWRKKWSIRYVYTPPFIQQMGLFGYSIDSDAYSAFLKKATTLFRFGDYFVNNAHAASLPQRTNFVLPLDQPYSQLNKRFAKDLKNNLKKAANYALQYKATDDYAKAVTLYRQLYQTKIGHLTPSDFDNFTALCQQLQHKNMITVREVLDAENVILATALCANDGKRLYLLANSTTAKGRQCKANHFLLDRLIQEFANTGYILDFEGSELPGVKEFYANFGAINQPYFFYHWNKLPFPLRLWKK